MNAGIARRVWAGLVIGLLVTAALRAEALGAEAAPAYVWLEGEQPTSANFKYDVWAGDKPELLSAGKWLNKTLDKDAIAKELPKDGFLLSYDFDAPQAGQYELWLHVGYELIRAPLDWRLDGGQWTTLAADVHTTDLTYMFLWCEVAWAKGGTVELTKGAHKLEIRYTQPGRDGRMLIGLDAIALVEGQGNFVPDARLQPGQQYDEAIDRQARENVFRFATAQAPAAGQRAELPLSGAWEVARYDDPNMDAGTYDPINALPDLDALHWRGLQVPGDARSRAELVFGHRLLYRTRVDVPADLAGRSFVLHFDGTNWIASVFVNGQLVGAHTSVLMPWDMDVTSALRPGQTNTIVLGIKGPMYSLDPKGPRKTFPNIESARNVPADENVLTNIGFVAPVWPGEGANGLAPGILYPARLVVAGPAYTSDVFVQTSVAKKHLDAAVTVSNPGAAPMDVDVVCQAVNDKTGQVEKEFPAVKVSVPAASTKEVSIGGQWEDAKLWWPSERTGDEPTCYRLRTTLKSGDRTLDVYDQLFGFREITIDGINVLINGIPWHFYEWGYPQQQEGRQGWLDYYHEHNDHIVRTTVGFVPGMPYAEDALDFYDRSGVPVRLCSFINGMFIVNNLSEDVVWQNFSQHVDQFVHAARNHPSVVMYSLENELMFITNRLAFGRDYAKYEDKFVGLTQLAKQIDPTRPSFGDGAGDCAGRTPINCQHYAWPEGGSFPTSAYGFSLKPADEDYAAFRKRTGDYQAWSGKDPLIGGEEFFYSGNLSAMAWIGGPDVYRGKRNANIGAGRYALIAAQGARWQGEMGFSIGSPPLPGAEVSLQPRAAFVREWNCAFFPGTELKRTIKVFNDGRSSEPLTLNWRLVLAGKEAASGTKTYTVPPGGAQEDAITAALPQAAARVDGQLELTLTAGGKTVFTDAKPVSLLPRSGKVDGLKAGYLAVFDPEGSARKWLDARGQDYVKLEQLDALPDSARTLLIGKDALSAENKKTGAAKVAAFATSGKTVIVLEQKDPLQGAELPLAGVVVAGQKAGEPARPEFAAAGGQSGCICFPVAPAHPVLKDLAAGDVFTWSGDETTFRTSYATPSTGCISIIQGGDELSLTPMMEIPVGTGTYLLSQMLIGTKLETEPVADRLLYNALDWASQRASARPGKTLALLGGDADLKAFLSGTPLLYESGASLADALSSDADVLIVKATPEAVAELNANSAKVKAFCEKGRWLMLCNLGEPALADFDKLVGFPHRFRPFRREAVTVQERTDPLLMGLSDRDFSMVSAEMAAAWRDLHWISSRVFTGAVDGREIASFARFDTEDLAKLGSGMTSDDFWPYINYFNADNGTVTFHFDRPETFTSMTICSIGVYYTLKDIEMLFDGKDLTLTLARTKEPQRFDFTPARKASEVTINIKSHYPGQSTQNLVQIDYVELYREVPADFDQRVVLLTHPGGLVKYPMGKGGILLDELDYAPGDTPENMHKKLTITTNLLRNMGASFGSGAAQK